jgi:4-amino-4-deoxy-L-arabinose transferase-like glycosyltransferase
MKVTGRTSTTNAVRTQLGRPSCDTSTTSDFPSGRLLFDPYHRETQYGWIVLAIVWLLCGSYAASHLHDGWIPYDAGALSHMAERVLRGQVPFRDFGEIYTGGLTYLNALAFHLLGVNFFSIRIPLFICFLGWIPALYFIARRFASPFGAGAVTLLAVAWSVPNYPEAMPSWYNLFFATWGVLSLLRYTETEKRRWLWIAGLCAGLSILVKISGLYFIAGVLLFFLFREQSLARELPDRSPNGGLLYRAFASVGLLLFLVSLADLVSARPTIAEFANFLLPSACLTAVLLWRIWREPSGADALRFGRLFSMLPHFLGGVLLPIAVFLAWFIRQNALGAWFGGVFFRPALRTQWAAYDAISPIAVFGLLPIALTLLAVFDAKPFIRRLARYAAPVVLAGLLLAARRWLAAYSFVAFSLPLLVPGVGLAALFRLRHSASPADPTRQQAFLVIAAAVTCALVQFPFSSATYFEFVAPLVILSLLVVIPVKKAEPVALGALLAFYLVFAVWLHTPGFYIGINVPTRQPFRLQTLALARAGGIRAAQNLASEYQKLVPLVRSHARGSYIYAAPDAPEIYFLSGLCNPTQDVYDALDPDFLNPSTRIQRTLAALREHEVSVVVLGPKDPAISGPVLLGLRTQLDRQYPLSATVGEFEVRWKP